MANAKPQEPVNPNQPADEPQEEGKENGQL